MTLFTRCSSPQSFQTHMPSHFATLQLWRARFISLALLVLLLPSGGNTKAQNFIHGSTPASQAPGAPSGSYALTGFENVNLFNGHLNFHLPLLSVKGRGESGYTIMLPIETRWIAEGQIGGGGFTPSFNWWTGIKPGYSPGVLQGRQIGEPCNWETQGTTGTTTRLTFTTNDGTEYELLDTQHGGHAALSECNSAHPGTGAMASRGKTFVSIDGAAATFISDSIIVDNVMAGDGPRLIYPTGNLFLSNGIRYRIDNGRVLEIRDRNGNLVSFEYENQNFWARVVAIKDSLDRQVSISYASASVNFDQITFKGFEGTPRSIKIERTNLGSALIAGESVSSYPTLFPQLLSSTSTFHNPEVVASVTLPNQKSYHFKYNRYGELARVDLPTGGRFEYAWGSGYASGDPSGTNGPESEIIRRVIERREYTDSTTLVGKITFGRLITTGSPITEGSVLVKTLKPNDELLTQDIHYFRIVSSAGGLFAIPSQLDGREFKTETLALDGSVLRTTTHKWETGGTFFATPKNPHITETTTTLNDTNQVSKQTFLYDEFNNRTDTYEFDFGLGSPGARRRHTRVTYLSSPAYTNANVHIKDRITQVSVFDGPDGAEKERSRTVYEYDDYSNSANHSPLKDWQAVTGIPMTGHDSAMGTSYLTRGNVTKTTQFLLAKDPTTNPAAVHGSVSIYNQYDLAGNVVRTIDAPGNTSDVEYLDRFGAPDGNAQANTGPSHLNSPTLKYTYAFPTKLTNAIGQIGFSQFDYYLGQPVDVEDINGVVSSSWYEDLLDRPTQVILANNQDLSVKNQITFAYDDTARSVTKNSSKDIWNDGLITTQTRYDGLGRTTEQRTYESASDYIATRTEYDALGRPFKTSSPFRPGQIEPTSWNIQTFDPLGRVTSVTTTPDNATVTTSYSGNTVTITDQAGKSQKSVTDALGRLVAVYEDPEVPGGPTELNYQTLYSYNTLDSLVKVTQGSQQRFFMYDSLKRLIRSRSPEHGTVPTLSLADPVSGNDAWSIGYQYDSNGNLTQKTDARGVVSTYVYDALNRNTTIDHSDTPSINPDVTRLYDGALMGKGRLWKSYAGGTESNGSNVERAVFDKYDALGRPLVLNQSFKLNNEWKPPYQTSRTYNVAGLVSSQSYPSGHVAMYNYDNAGRLADKDVDNLAFIGSLGDGNFRTYSKAITYTPNGQLRQEQFGTTTPLYNKLLYNSRQQLAEILVSTTGGDSYNRGRITNGYSLQCSGAGCEAADNNGNLRKQQIDIPTNEQSSSYVSWHQLYDYDSLNRLQSVREVANGVQQWRQWFSYDRWGNRTIDTTQDQGDPNPRTYGVGINNNAFEREDSTNRLYAPGDLALSDNQRRIRYDSAGNQTKDIYTGYGSATFDAENHITAIQDKDGGTTTYTYNADGQRTRRKIRNQETWQIYGMDGELLAEYPAGGAANAPQKEYGYRNGQLLISAEAGNASTPPVVAEDFNDNSLNTSLWSRHSLGSPTVSEQAQQLQIALSPNTAGYNGVFSTSTYDLTNRMVQVESVQAVSQAGWCENFLELELNTNNYFMIQVGAGNMILRARVNGVNDQTVIPFDGAANKFWRIRHEQSANLIHFETSATGNVWLTRKTVTAGFSLTALRVHLLAGAYGGGNSNPGTAKYDNLMLLSSTGITFPLTVQNGGFEAPVIGNGNWQYAPSGGVWSFAVGGGVTGMNSAFTGVPSMAPEGVQVAFIQGNGTVWQSVSGFQANADYVISFSAIQRTNCCNAGGQDIGVFIDTTQIGTVHPGSSGYTEYSIPFSTTAGAHTIKFVGLNPLGGDHTAFIDNVRLTGFPKPGYGIQWLVADHLGTPRMVLDESGSLANVKRHDYLPFGEELIPQGLRTGALGYTTGDGVRQQFTAKERDNETGLDYFGARYYASVQGRFTGPDLPFADQQAENPQSWNLYSYTVNNPLRFVDLDGRIKQNADGTTYIKARGQIVPSKYESPVTFHNYPKEKNKGSATVTWRSQEVTLLADDGKTDIKAFVAVPGTERVTIVDPDGNVYTGGMELLPKGSSVQANCFGTTFAGGDVWINGDQVAGILEGDGYKKIDKPAEQDVAVFTDPISNYPGHAVRADGRTTDGKLTVTSKDAVGPKKTGQSPGPGPGTAWDKPANVQWYKKTTPEPKQ